MLYEVITLLRLGRLVHAGQALEFGYREMGVDTAPLWNVLGVVRARQGRWAEAIQSFARAADIAPQNSRYQDNLRRARLGVMVDSMEID